MTIVSVVVQDVPPPPHVGHAGVRPVQPRVHPVMQRERPAPHHLLPIGVHEPLARQPAAHPRHRRRLPNRLAQRNLNRRLAPHRHAGDRRVRPRGRHPTQDVLRRRTPARRRRHSLAPLPHRVERALIHSRVERLRRVHQPATPVAATRPIHHGAQHLRPGDARGVPTRHHPFRTQPHLRQDLVPEGYARRGREPRVARVPRDGDDERRVRAGFLADQTPLAAQ
mmetsp:Transcript_1089/g.4471  ORF Transcript_1089/g.4471 Transcript_1089/m.4471 type:complete len:224 (-) Transcript_1089:536-1207(-)